MNIEVRVDGGDRTANPLLTNQMCYLLHQKQFFVRTYPLIEMFSADFSYISFINSV